jgi:hypothetical protein
MHARLQWMRSRAKSWFLLALLAVGALAISTPAMAAQGLKPTITSSNSGKSNNNKKAKPPKLTKDAKFEITLLKKLIDREARITSTTQLAQANTTDTFVLAIADTISSQSLANLTFLKDRLKVWYGIDYNGKKVNLDDDLTSASEEFDIEFISALKGLLQSQVAHYSQAARKAPHAELRAFAREAILDYRVLIGLLKDWLKEQDPDLED